MFHTIDTFGGRFGDPTNFRYLIMVRFEVQLFWSIKKSNSEIIQATDREYTANVSKVTSYIMQNLYK